LLALWLADWLVDLSKRVAMLSTESLVAITPQEIRQSHQRLMDCHRKLLPVCGAVFVLIVIEM
jgi:hypothetical protein